MYSRDIVPDTSNIIRIMKVVTEGVSVKLWQAQCANEFITCFQELYKPQPWNKEQQKFGMKH